MKESNSPQSLKDTLVIVSGIPRSGTSLLMQMLKTGGMEILADNKRKPDESNPKGYLELDAVKKLAQDNSCLKNQAGKVVKVISHLLKYLPESQKYKIIFMNRDMHEIMASQSKMLNKNEKKFSKELIKAFLKELKQVKEWIKTQPNKEILNLHYKKILKNPSKQIEKLIDFLGISLDTTAMIEAIDPTLYRNKLDALDSN
ncbi:MAG: hypothetical protein BAJALOKI1v1_2290002 [Promethearchaeota archaeon]|nr:MAG: hypothetical protein BAJALOKI1v1_2290002 [Candidatus Lokiarchaeota archaeon]